MGFKNK
jgi:hypothetical protein